MMFRVEYEMFSPWIVSDVQILAVETLQDAELAAVAVFGYRLGLEKVTMRHSGNLDYEVLLVGDVIGRFKITTVSDLTEITPQHIF